MTSDFVQKWLRIDLEDNLCCNQTGQRVTKDSIELKHHHLLLLRLFVVQMKELWMFARDLNSFVEDTVQTCAQNDSMGYGLLGHFGQTLYFSQCFDKKFKYLHSNYHQIKSSTSCSFSPVPIPPSKIGPSHSVLIQFLKKDLAHKQNNMQRWHQQQQGDCWIWHQWLKRGRVMKHPI